ncbi:hypothetical protein ACM66B_001542 [Microbotryomycetes sp. NB124-2]
MGTAAPISAPTLASGSSSKRATASAATAKSAGGDKWANYSTPEQLGFAEDPDVLKFRAEQEKRKQEGVIGEWQRVAVPAAAHAASGSSSSTTKVEAVNDTVSQALAEEQEQERPTTQRWLKEKSLDGAESEWDPSKVKPIQVKRKVLTLQERQELQDKEKPERENKKVKLETARSDGTASKGWQQVDTSRETEFSFVKGEQDGQEAVKTEDGVVKTEAGLAAESSSADGASRDGTQDIKPDVKPVVPSTGFKKRRMHGGPSAAIRKK